MARTEGEIERESDWNGVEFNLEKVGGFCVNIIKLKGWNGNWAVEEIVRGGRARRFDRWGRPSFFLTFLNIFLQGEMIFFCEGWFLLDE